VALRIGGLIVLILWIAAVFDVARSQMGLSKKLIWILAILLLPLVGSVLWFLIGE